MKKLPILTRFFAILAVFLAVDGDLLTFERTFLENGLFPVKEIFWGSWYSYFFNYIHSLLHLGYKFYTVRPKKIRQNSLSLNLDLDRLNGTLMAYIYFLQSKFDSRRNFDSLHVSVLYKMTQR